jgi:hypothetical protein
MPTLLAAAPVPVPREDRRADPPTTVTALYDRGRVVTYGPGLGTTVEGLALAVFGSSQTEFDATKQEWDEGLKARHVRVQYARPRAIRLRVDGDKVYEVSEVLIGFSPGQILARCGEKYYKFGKYDGKLWMIFEQNIPAKR